MSRTSPRKNRHNPSNPLEQPSVSQVYYPQDVHRLIRQIGEAPGNMQEEQQPAQKLHILSSNELGAGSAEDSTDPQQSLAETREQIEQNNPETQLQNQLPHETQLEPQLLQEELPMNVPVVDHTQPHRPEIIDLDKFPAMPGGSSGVVDLTVDLPNNVSVVDLTGDHVPANVVAACPVIVHVNREPQEWPSCRFASRLPRQHSLYNDEIQELPLVQKPSGESSKAEEEVDPNSKKAITCPVCLDDYEMLKRRKRQLMSTICGHIFCDKCIKDAVQLQSRCPTCRKKLSRRQLHPIFI